MHSQANRKSHMRAWHVSTGTEMPTFGQVRYVMCGVVGIARISAVVAWATVVCKGWRGKR